MHLWRKLQVGGPAIRPIRLFRHAAAGRARPLVDVLVGTTGGVDCDFMFDSADGTLVGLEMFPEDDADPCEVYFSDYREVEGRFMPQRIEVHYGDNLFGILTSRSSSSKRGAGK